MKAAVLNQIPGELEIEDISVDKPGRNEVLVQVVNAGLCHSDLHFMDAAWQTGLPAVMGHEKGSGNKALGGKLAGMTWGVLMAGPIIAMIVGLVLHGVTVTSGALLGAFVVLTGVNFGLHVKDCRECKMRYSCAMSAAKK